MPPDEKVVDDPKVDDPKVDDPKVDDPKVDDPKVDDKGKGAADGKDTALGGDSKVEGDEKPSAPEKYEDFKVPDGVEISAEQLELASPVFKELGLTQEQAQKLVTLEVSRMEAQAAESAKVSKEWVDELKKGEETGGADFEANLEKVRGFIARAAGDDAEEVKAILNGSPIGNFPPLFRMFLRIANATAEGTFAGKGSGGPPEPGSAEADMALLRQQYPSMFNEDGTPKAQTQ
jgi:hypothetical protein